MSNNIFTGTIPALDDALHRRAQADFDALVRKAKQLIETGMSAVVYCGSMGDWPLLAEAERQEGVARLVAAGIPTTARHRRGEQPRSGIPRRPRRQGRRPRPDGHSARAVPRRFAGRPGSPLRRHSRGGT